MMNYLNMETGVESRSLQHYWYETHGYDDELAGFIYYYYYYYELRI